MNCIIHSIALLIAMIIQFINFQQILTSDTFLDRNNSAKIIKIYNLRNTKGPINDNISWRDNGTHKIRTFAYYDTSEGIIEDEIIAYKDPQRGNQKRFIRINTPKDFSRTFGNGSAIDVNKVSDSSKFNRLNLNNERYTGYRSTSDFIDYIHNFKDVEEFPDIWRKILGDSKKRKENVVFFEVPLIDRPFDENSINKIGNNASVNDNSKLIEKERKPKIVTEDEFVFDMEKPSIDESSEESGEPSVSQRFLNIFQIVKFHNKDCYSSNGVKGICLHPYECDATSGISAGPCAEGYGTCCVNQYSCGDQTASNCSTFTNPNFPKPSLDRLSCTFTVQKANSDVTQLRLEIVQLELLPPTNGTCVEDQFVITGQNINNMIPILCGINNDQHLYVDVGESSGPFYLSVMTSRPAERLIQVRVCQLGPKDLKAPQGCLQYHQSVMGYFESLNYRADGSIPGYRLPGYMNNLNYAICVARAPSTCSITYSVPDDGIFQIANFDADGMPLLPPGQAGVEVFNCPDDYIVVNGIRLCGDRLNDASLTEDFTLNVPVTETSAGPIVFVFRSNGNVTGRGFRLAYRQNLCTPYYG